MFRYDFWWKFSFKIYPKSITSINFQLIIFTEEYVSTKHTLSTRRFSQFDLESSIDQKDTSDMFSYIKQSSTENAMLSIIDDFFGISETFGREIEMANKIKSAFKKMKFRKTVKKFKKCVYKTINYTTELEELPTELLITILSFLEQKELYGVSQWNKYFYSLAFDRSLWSSLQIKDIK
jgi:hypothetical protein